MATRDWMAACIERHADPAHGAPFWIQRLARLGLTARDAAREPDAVPVLTAEELRGLPVEVMLPESERESAAARIVSETSGFTGPPVRTLFAEAEFHAGFVAPFLDRARATRFPAASAWLWAGPSGPHIIGKAIRAILRAAGGREPFEVDFDPRWFRRLPAGSLSARRYMAHIVEQALDILARERVDVLFSTPPVLRALADRLTPAQRARIRGVHYGGMAMEPAEYRAHRAAFPEAVHLSGYGNSLFGMFPETGFTDAGLAYATASDRLAVRVARREGDRWTDCDVGETGAVIWSRFDRSVMLLNMAQEDVAERTADGVSNPRRADGRWAGRAIY